MTICLQAGMTMYKMGSTGGTLPELCIEGNTTAEHDNCEEEVAIRSDNDGEDTKEDNRKKTFTGANQSKDSNILVDLVHAQDKEGQKIGCWTSCQKK